MARPASAAGSMTGSGNGNPGVVLAPLHVSCFVTAANRATPVFDVQHERRCVRVVTKPPPHSSSSGADAATLSAASLSPSSPENPTAEWEFHSVFATSASHSSDFFRDITQPALRSVLSEGINTNILCTGIHPTQKFRLLFGKSTSSSTTTPSSVVAEPESEKGILDLHGQLGGLLFDFFQRGDTPRDWKLGVSSWIVVNNQAVDLLKSQPEISSSAAATSAGPLSFASVEATSLASALQILQTAKTHRIVMKHTAEHSHFFVRLAFFQCSTGQLSTLHLVDLMDLKDFRDASSMQEKQELYEIFHEIRAQTAAMAAAGGAAAALASPRNKQRQSVVSKDPKTMLLSNFLQPLLTQNARTFLYVNVIDSRASLRESVALLNAVANIKGFACVCKKLTGIAFSQLGFQAPPVVQPASLPLNDEGAMDSAAAKAMAAVAIGESLLNRLASGQLTTSTAQPQAVAATRAAHHEELPLTETASGLPSPAVTSDAMSWLEAFKQRKKDILNATSNSPPPLPPRGSNTSMDELPLGLSETSSPASIFPVPAARSGSSGDLYARLMDTFNTASSSVNSPGFQSTVLPTVTVPGHTRPPFRRSNSVPLPIEDPQEDPLPPPPLPQQQRASLTSDLAARISSTAYAKSGFVPRGLASSSPPPPRAISLDNMELPPRNTAPPNVDGLDATMAAKIQATDATLLRKNYDALLNVVREQQHLREVAETKAREVVHDAEEVRAQHEVQIENLKLEVVALKSKVRALERQTGCAQVFDQYEAELQRCQREVQQLRMQNVELELKLASSSTHGAPDKLSRTPRLYGGFEASITDLKKKYQAMAQDKTELERQLAEYRKKDRHFQAQSKLINESSRRVDRLSRELNEKEDVLVSAQLGRKRLSAEVAIAQQESQQLQQENERLLMEKAATTEELLAAKMYLASVESEQKKAAILDKFVRKHGDRMQRLRGPTGLFGGGGDPGNNSSHWVDAETWRRDAQAREAEEKLFQGVKRSVPQLVPLANKVLRKLELQELSLREYAEREVDFINLLVELASDQPAMALKAMIEEEMKKLSIF